MKEVVFQFELMSSHTYLHWIVPSPGYTIAIKLVRLTHFLQGGSHPLIPISLSKVCSFLLFALLVHTALYCSVSPILHKDSEQEMRENI